MEDKGLTYSELITGDRECDEFEIKKEYNRIYKGLEHTCSYEEFKRIYAIRQAYDNGDPIPF